MVIATRPDCIQVLTSSPLIAAQLRGITPAARAAMIEPLLDLATLIDLELRSAAQMQGTIQKARAAGVPVVGSFHDFQATPAEEVLREVAATPA